jgi:hypothetical protein
MAHAPPSAATTAYTAHGAVVALLPQRCDAAFALLLAVHSDGVAAAWHIHVHI